MNVRHLISQPIYFFNESVIPSLTNQQKKILVVALAALACLAACLYYFLRVKTEAPKTKQVFDQKEVDPVEEADVIDAKPQADLSAHSLLVPTSQPVQYSPFEFGGDDTQNPAVTPELIAENAEARRKIVEALGGEDACKLIPIVECPKLSAYLDCFDKNGEFPKRACRRPG